MIRSMIVMALMIVMLIIIVMMMLMMLHNLLNLGLCALDLGGHFCSQTPFQMLGALVDHLVELADATVHLSTNQITNIMATFISTPNTYTQNKYNKSCFISLSSVLPLMILGLAQHYVTLNTSHIWNILNEHNYKTNATCNGHIFSGTWPSISKFACVVQQITNMHKYMQATHWHLLHI